MGRTYYLAVDIGASSGRHILSYTEDGVIRTEEIYRFKNGQKNDGGTLVWDTGELFRSIVEGMKKAKELGKIPSYMAIDTWGVDFVLINGRGKVVGKPVGYRDSRNDGMEKEVSKIISPGDLYRRTGIQFQRFNTIYQLAAVKKYHPEELGAAKKLLFIPDYFNYLLTGKAECEYTEASTSNLLSVGTGTWDRELIEMLGLPSHIFLDLKMPGTKIGRLRNEIAREIGYDLTVMHAASHDTGSAVLAVPTSSDDVAYLSSGTWSLLGVESMEPIVTDESMAANVTNEGGYDMRYRCLKNITGLWMIQSIRGECGGKYTFDELCGMAAEYGNTTCRVDVNDEMFLAPENMTEAVRKAMGKPDAPLGEVLATVYHSLADCYARTIKQISRVSGKKLSALHIIGGGSKDDLLNRLTAEACGIDVYTGPTEATAIGNLIAQMLGTGAFSSLAEARAAVAGSFDVKKIDIRRG